MGRSYESTVNTKNEKNPLWKRWATIGTIGAAAFGLVGCGENEKATDEQTYTQSSTVEQTNDTTAKDTVDLSSGSVEVTSSTTAEKDPSTSKSPETEEFEGGDYITLRYEIDPNDQEAVNEFADKILSYIDMQYKHCQVIEPDDAESFVISHMYPNGDSAGRQTDVNFCKGVSTLSGTPSNGKLSTTVTRTADASINIGEDGLPVRVEIPLHFTWVMKYRGLADGTYTVVDREQSGETTANAVLGYLTVTDPKTSEQLQAWVSPK